MESSSPRRPCSSTAASRLDQCTHLPRSARSFRCADSRKEACEAATALRRRRGGEFDRHTACVRTLGLAAEHGCWPLWETAIGPNVNPASLPISPSLVQALDAWSEAQEHRREGGHHGPLRLAPGRQVQPDSKEKVGHDYPGCRAEDPSEIPDDTRFALPRRSPRATRR
jgi:hypothetical protein